MHPEDPDIAQLIKRAQDRDKLCSYARLKAGGVLSFVRNHDKRISGYVECEGHACWHVVNESTARKLRTTLRARVRSRKAVWARGAVADARPPDEIEVEVEVPRDSCQDYSERFFVTEEGEEAVITNCQNHTQTLTSGFFIQRAAPCPSARPSPPATVSGPDSNPTLRVFVSYSHEDAAYLERGSLLPFLSGLKDEGFEFWDDRSILAGESWEDRIKEEIASADIALILVSQAFIVSPYCMNEEVSRFLARRAEGGLEIFPVILSSCDWKTKDWLQKTQFEPRGGQTIEGDYDAPGKRKEIYLRILEQLRALGAKIRARRGSL